MGLAPPLAGGGNRQCHGPRVSAVLSVGDISFTLSLSLSLSLSYVVCLCGAAVWPVSPVWENNRHKIQRLCFGALNKERPRYRRIGGCDESTHSARTLQKHVLFHSQHPVSSEYLFFRPTSQFFSRKQHP